MLPSVGSPRSHEQTIDTEELNTGPFMAGSNIEIDLHYKAKKASQNANAAFVDMKMGSALKHRPSVFSF